MNRDLITAIAAQKARAVDAYQDSADEVGHSEGQPIIETFPQLEQLIAEAIAEYAETAALRETELVSLQDAVKLRYGGYSTLRKYIADGRLPAVRVGPRSIRVRLSDLEALGTPAAGRPSDQAAIDAAIDKLVATAPKLKDWQIRHLSSLLAD